jgi:chromate transporter
VIHVSSFGLSFDAPILSSVNLAALALSIAAAVAIFKFDVGMLVVLAGSCLIGLALHLAGII